ncbi:MAG: TonB-dependent receptor [Gammaproteobacteria bacterium]
MNFRLLPHLTLLLLATAPVQVQADEDATELEPVIVTASPFGREADELVQPVEVLSGRELDRKRAATIGDTLDAELGVSNADFGTGVGRPVIRGQGGARVLILENGIGSMDVSTVSADHGVSIDPAHAGQVEILKGPATLIYGSAASAGVVNVVNPRLREKLDPGFHGLVDLSYGDNADERNGVLGASLGWGEFVVGGDFAQRKTGTFEIPGFASREPEPGELAGRLNNSSVETRSGAGYAAWILPERALSVAYSRYFSDYGIPGAAEEPPPGEVAVLDGVRIKLKQNRADVQGLWFNPLAGFDRLRVRLGRNDYEHTEFEPTGEAGTTFSNREFEGRAELGHAPIGRLRGVIGTQIINRDFSAVGEEAFIQPVQTETAGLFIVEELQYGWGRLEAGARVERVEHTPALNRPDDGSPNVDPRTGAQQPGRTFKPGSLALGSIWDLDPVHHLRAGYTRAERAPVAEELYAFGPHLATATFERGDSRAGVETANNFELSLDRHGDRWSWTLNGYYNRLSDYLYLVESEERRNADGSASANAALFQPGEPDRVDEAGQLDPNGELLLVDYRQADAAFYGAEAKTRYQLLRGPVTLDAEIFGDLVRGRLDDGAGNLPRITPERYGLGLDARYGRLRGDLRLTRVEGQTRIASLETETGGYEMLGLNLEFIQPQGGWTQTYYLRARNLLDEEARRHTSFLKDRATLPGRSVFAGIKLSF